MTEAASMKQCAADPIDSTASLLRLLFLRDRPRSPPTPIADKAKLCATCHGEQGVPTQKNDSGHLGPERGLPDSSAPRLQERRPQERLDVADRRRHRSQTTSTPLAAYFSKLKWPNLQQPPAPADVATKAQAAAASIGCPGCHLAYFQGDGTTARLAGQNHDYLLKTMNDFRDGTRGNNPGMSDLMKATSPDDIGALAQYLAGLQIDQYLNQGN